MTRPRSPQAGPNGHRQPIHHRETISHALRRTSEELAASRARIVTTADETRRRVVRDLHDGAQNRMVQVILTLALAERARDAGDAEGAGELHAQAAGLAEQANADLRELSHGILPNALR
jgi:signal transduction histidine kinase